MRGTQERLDDDRLAGVVKGMRWSRLPAATEAVQRAVPSSGRRVLVIEVPDEDADHLLDLLEATPATQGRTPIAPAFGLEHDAYEERFYLHGRPLKLGRQDYKLLAFLCRYRGKPFTRQQLLAGAWEGDRRGERDSLYSALRRLRRALGPDAQRMIWTDRAAGVFRFVPEPAEQR